MPRLQIGIDRPVKKSQVVSHVLGSFREEERVKIQTAIAGGLDLLLHHISSRMLLSVGQNEDISQQEVDR